MDREILRHGGTYIPKSRFLRPTRVGLMIDGYPSSSRLACSTSLGCTRRHRPSGLPLHSPIRDLPSKRLHVFDPKSVPAELKALVGDKIREGTVFANWPDVVRSVATIASGAMPPSELLRKLASYPRQHDLAVAFREIGRVERTLFMIEWLLDADMQRRAGLGLNKGEAHHALKSALRIGRQGEIRDRMSGAQHFRIAGINLLTATIICWNTEKLGHAVRERELAGLDTPPDLLVHVSPLGWAHVLLTGEYRWRKTMASRA